MTQVEPKPITHPIAMPAPKGHCRPSPQRYRRGRIAPLPTFLNRPRCSRRCCGCMCAVWLRVFASEPPSLHAHVGPITSITYCRGASSRWFLPLAWRSVRPPTGIATGSVSPGGCELALDLIAATIQAGVGWHGRGGPLNFGPRYIVRASVSQKVDCTTYGVVRPAFSRRGQECRGGLADGSLLFLIYISRQDC